MDPSLLSRNGLTIPEETCMKNEAIEGIFPARVISEALSFQRFRNSNAAMSGLPGLQQSTFFYFKRARTTSVCFEDAKIAFETKDSR